uniref:Carrier domain-containing protein n=1 Tax=Pyrodinium bahamense TaxID=73915 RepID=A0A7S0AR53_9DINO
MSLPCRLAWLGGLSAVRLLTRPCGGGACGLRHWGFRPRILSFTQAALHHPSTGLRGSRCKVVARAASQEVIERIRARREARRGLATPRVGPPASPETLQRVVDIIQTECPSYAGQVTPETTLSALQGNADSLDTLEAMMELEEQFKVELTDDEMDKVNTVRELADLIYRTPRGIALRTVDDQTLIAMIRRSHAENRWGELDDLENNIPPQYIHQGPSLAEEEGKL